MGRENESEKQHSGGESDTSITSANVKSRWFRRSRDPSKARTSSDSGMVTTMCFNHGWI